MCRDVLYLSLTNLALPYTLLNVLRKKGGVKRTQVLFLDVTRNRSWDTAALKGDILVHISPCILGTSPCSLAVWKDKIYNLAFLYNHACFDMPTNITYFWTGRRVFW
jgi:hypothetical protein